MLFPPNLPEESRQVRADWIEEAIQISRGVFLSNAVIIGPLRLRYASIEKELVINNSVFTQVANFSYATFKQNCDFSGSVFHQGVLFDSAKLEYDGRFDRVQFLSGPAIFNDMRVRGIFSAQQLTTAENTGVLFNRTVFEKTAVFISSTFAGTVDFQNASVGGSAQFYNAKFNNPQTVANFGSVEIKGDLFFQKAVFAGEARFVFAKIGASAFFQAVTFLKKANFNSTTIGNGAFFRIEPTMSFGPVIFGDEVDFLGADIGSSAEFDGAQFSGSDKVVRFERIRIGADAFFRGVLFNGPTSFAYAQIHSRAEFQGALFKGAANFYAISIGGFAWFIKDTGRNLGPVVFEKALSFMSSYIGGDAVFQEVQFKGPADFTGAQIVGHSRFEEAHFWESSNPNFILTQFKNGAWFNNTNFDVPTIFTRSRFESNAEFMGALFKEHVRFDGCIFTGAIRFGKVESDPVKYPAAKFRSANFNYTQFIGEARFNGTLFSAEATFIGAKFESVAEFNTAKFSGSTDFTSARGAGDIDFLESEFSGPISFRESHFVALHFGRPPVVGQSIEHETDWSDTELLERSRFQAPVDLRGLSYDRMNVHLDDLFSWVEAAAFDRQPYTQLEKSLRKVGDDIGADRVYLQRRRVERRRMAKQGRWFKSGIDRIYEIVGKYGILSWRLLISATLLVILGGVILSFPGGLEPKDSNSGNPSDYSIRGSVYNFPGRQISVTDDAVDSWRMRFVVGLEVSFHEFVPVDVPVGDRWRPLSEWAAICGACLRILGTILVGVGLGAATGILRRVSP